jgi:Fe/S biogenesis protein NfuA
MVLAFMDQSGEELRALRVHMDGSPVAPSFALTLVGEDERRAEDLELDGGGFVVVVDRQSAERLDGATVDFVNRVNGSGFEVITAESTGPPTPHAAPTGDLAEKVRLLLEEQVNPAIAGHGGRIELVDVQGTEVYMEMTGGCQGCAMSRATLRQGVERMIRQNIPEVTAIHDATDHAAGENPFYRR